MTTTENGNITTIKNGNTTTENGNYVGDVDVSPVVLQQERHHVHEVGQHGLHQDGVVSGVLAINLSAFLD